MGEPSWFVARDRAVYGPMSTKTLLSELAAGRFDEDCWTWQSAWQRARPLGELREVAALRLSQRSRGPSWRPSEAWCRIAPAARSRSASVAALSAAEDEGEVVALALKAVVDETRAAGGLLHRPRWPLGSLVTKAVVGPYTGQLGAEIDPRDRAVARGRMGAAVLTAPESTAAGSAALDRLGTAGPMRAVALAPIHRGPRLVALLEIGKVDHGFRDTDHEVLRRVSRAAASRLATLDA